MFAYLLSDIARQERKLLGAAAVFVLLNHVLFISVREEPWYALWPILVWAVCAFGMHIVASLIIPQHDPYIIPLVMLLSGWGVTLVARLAPAFSDRQVIWLVVSATAGTAMALLPPKLRMLYRFRYTWLLLGLCLLASTIIFGVNPSGSQYAPRLWLGFRLFYFQPSELLKLLLVVFLASYLADKREIITTTQVKWGNFRLPALPYIGPLLLMWGFCMILLVWQRDLGAASLFFVIFLSLLYVTTSEKQYLYIGAGLLVVAGVAGYALFDVVRLRIDTWINPWAEASGRAFQIVQSLLAIAAGGVFGRGVGFGAPTYIPVVHSDFVFAAIAEEWGLIGSLGVLICLSLLVFRALHIASSNEDMPFKALLAAGIGISLGMQSLLIMGGVTKLLPLTGVTLPFVSYGGSSLLSSFIMIGLLLRISDPVSQLTFSAYDTDSEADGSQ